MRALAIAATGMSAQEQNLEVIANNVANINTTGFKRSRAEFTDLIYQTERLMGVSNRGRDATVPEGAQIGLGVRTAAIRSVNIQGALTNTGNQLDLAIQGRGWFQVTTPNGDTVYTRDGAFNTNANGQLVTMDGYNVNPSILVPRPDHAAAARPIDDRELRQRSWPLGARRQLLPADRRVRPAYGRRSGRHFIRDHPAGLRRGFQRRSRHRDHQPYCGSARL
jgi:flagellar hook-basal body protein